ncbi:MAG TPA: hypothetical protein VLX29_10505 [Nitrospirota bacterium]|nr:hypothetical protein [Nitrospirota bacterium]
MQRLFVFVMFIVVHGCALPTMKPIALTPKTNALNLQKESVALLTVRTSNQYKPDYQPYVWRVVVVTNDGRVKKTNYRFGDLVGGLERFEEIKGQFNEYLISLSLPAGNYKLTFIKGTGSVTARGNFDIPVFADFELPPNKIVYLGRIEATLRERKSSSELRGGPEGPLLDQLFTGFYAGTFDIVIYDNYDKDISLFKQKYVLLNNFTIEKAILPPWKQPSEDELKNFEEDFPYLKN